MNRITRLLSVTEDGTATFYAPLLGQAHVAAVFVLGVGVPALLIEE